MKIGLYLIVPGLLFCGLTSAQQDIDHLAEPCGDGPFCDLPGGIYLNAIYRQDRETIERIDRQHLDEIDEFVRSTSENMGLGGDNPLVSMFSNVTNKTEVFVTGAANKYLYEFKHWPVTCRKPGATEKTFVEQGPDMVEVDEYGATQVIMKGEIYEATYVTNPEFFTLRDQVGSAHGAGRSKSRKGLKTSRTIYLGIEQMRSRYRCDSEAMQGFERGLLAVTTQALAEIPELTLGEILTSMFEPSAGSTASGNADGSTSVYSRPQAGINKQDSTTSQQRSQASAEAQAEALARAQELAMVQAEARAQAQARVQAQVEAQARAQAEARAEAQAQAQQQAERYQQMNAELQQLSGQYTQRLTALSEQLQQDMQAATTNEARVAAQQAYQAGIQKLRQDMQTAGEAIRNKWQPGRASAIPSATPPVTSAAPTVTTSQQQMNAELQALGASYTRRIQLLGESLQQEIKTVATAEERNQLFRSYQEQMRQLQQQAQADTQAIRERYQQQ